MKHKLIMENWKKFLNEANEASEIDVKGIVSRYVEAELRYRMSSGEGQDDAIAELIEAKAALDNIPPERAQEADDIAFEMAQRIKKDEDSYIAATSKPWTPAPGDIDLDKI